jgi:hypothetical protein
MPSLVPQSQVSSHRVEVALIVHFLVNNRTRDDQERMSVKLEFEPIPLRFRIEQAKSATAWTAGSLVEMSLATGFDVVRQPCVGGK